MMVSRAPRVGFAVRVLGTLALAAAAAVLCAWLHTPIPWMLGPLLVTAVASLTGAPTASWAPLRNGGQWVIGTALGLYFTPQVGALVAGLWWAIALGIAWALLMGWGFGRWLQRVHAPHLSALSVQQLRATTYFAGAIGGASEMTLLAERAGARTDLVASAHSLRVLLVTVCIPFGMAFWGVSGLDLAPPGVRTVTGHGLALLAVCTLVGALVARRLGRANPWFMGALLVAMGVTLSGQVWSAIPSVVPMRWSTRGNIRGACWRWWSRTSAPVRRALAMAPNASAVRCARRRWRSPIGAPRDTPWKQISNLPLQASASLPPAARTRRRRP